MNEIQKDKQMSVLGGVAKALSVPMIILNTFGSIVAVIWLAIVGEWITIGIGVLFYIVYAFLLDIPLLLLPVLVRPGVVSLAKGNFSGAFLLMAVSNIYASALMIMCCIGVLYVFVPDANTPHLLPKLILSYGIALGPWSTKAHKSVETDYAGQNLLFFVQIAFIVLIIAMVFFSVTWLQAIKIFAVLMAISTAACIVLYSISMKKLI